jgi:hypothetical protein
MEKSKLVVCFSVVALEEIAFDSRHAYGQGLENHHLHLSTCVEELHRASSEARQQCIFDPDIRLILRGLVA